MYKTTFHSGVERQSRIVYIATHMGFGQVMFTKYNPVNNTIRQLTSTGIIIIVSADNPDIVVTMYVANMTQTKEIAGDRLPASLLKTVQRNCKNKEDEKSNRYRY